MNLRSSGSSRIVLIIGAVIVLCLCVVFIGGRSLLGGVSNILGGGGPSGVEGQLGRMYVASEVDREGCPITTDTRFESDEIIFVGLDESQVPAGSSLFVRLYREGRPVEDTQAIQADRDLRTCVWFQFEPAGSTGFVPGSYEAELYVNGNPADSVTFQVTESRAGGLLPGTGSQNVQLGRVYTSSEIDQNGCPLDDVYEFYPDEPVYVSIDRSDIPRGTEMFARLYENGRTIEDTDVIYADRDMQTCVWFSFESGRGGGLQPGSYEVEIFVNGRAVEVVDFIVR
jgi:hypothetical protein